VLPPRLTASIAGFNFGFYEGKKEAFMQTIEAALAVKKKVKTCRTGQIPG